MVYTVGFAFTEDRQLVLLQKKLRPPWQKGYLNGVGGKIEHGEHASRAMHRECLEETGLSLIWLPYGEMHGLNNDNQEFRCYIYGAFSDKVKQYKQIEDELLGLHFVKDINELKVIENLKFIIPFILCNDHSTYMTIGY